MGFPYQSADTVRNVSASPLPTRRPVLRWGLGDVAWIWLAGLVLSILAVSVVAGVRSVGPDHRADGLDLAAGLLAQGLGMLATAALIARRKGRGSLRVDFGLTVRVADWPWLAAGVLLQVGSFGLVWVLEAAGSLPRQEAARVVGESGGLELFVAAIGVAVLAPVAEELLFRGVLLRALLRRTTPGISVAASAVLFAGVHPILDPATLPLIVPLLALGALSGVRAVRTGDLSQSILLHAGFNLLGVIGLLSVTPGL